MRDLPLRRILYVANTILIVAVIVTLGVLTASVIEAGRQVQEFNERQVTIVQEQNDLQLCTQHDLTIAVKKIGRKLGLPVDDITPPNVEAIDCASLQAP